MSKAAKICALFVNTSDSKSIETWTRIKKSTQLTISQNPETEDYDYIADITKTTEIKAYAPTIDQDLAILPNEPDYSWFYEQYKNQPVGADAHHDFLTVYLLDGNNSAGYYAVKQEAVLSFTDYNAVDGVINYNIAFCGTPIKGTAKITEGTCTFTPTQATE